ncbi:MAG: N-acetylmannosaminyltransferase [Epulopiscium sp. Nuni2H_MBin003]|nr:MAG: N-acetylmannosaminyltransferase [Epulopiscium sp. Nuni2H_MBin003]
MRDQTDVLGIKIDIVTMDRAVRVAKRFIDKSKRPRIICTPNPEIIMLAQQNRMLKNILNKADMVVPDGIGVVIASRILNQKPLPERVAGYDLVQNLMKLEGNKFYFLGAEKNIVKMAANKMQKKYPIKVVGYRDGYFKAEQTKDIVNEINSSGANILLVALGAPKQEIWISENIDNLPNIKIVVGVGGSFDVMAGKVKRAPKMFRSLGLEWFYRLITQPTRAKRMLVLPKFLIKVIVKKVKLISGII